MRNGDNISIRRLERKDCYTISSAFEAQGWSKPVPLFESYLAESLTGSREIRIAEIDGEFAGYVTIDWQPEYSAFRESSIPEIADLNVLVRSQKRGVGTNLMEAAEYLISERSDRAGIRVGLTADYGNAHRLYIRRGYIPDGCGISHCGNLLKYGDTVKVDDDLTLGFIKALK